MFEVTGNVTSTSVNLYIRILYEIIMELLKKVISQFFVDKNNFLALYCITLITEL